MADCCIEQMKALRLLRLLNEPTQLLLPTSPGSRVSWILRIARLKREVRATVRVLEISLLCNHSMWGEAETTSIYTSSRVLRVPSSVHGALTASRSGVYELIFHDPNPCCIFIFSYVAAESLIIIGCNTMVNFLTTAQQDLLAVNRS